METNGHVALKCSHCVFFFFIIIIDKATSVALGFPDHYPFCDFFFWIINICTFVPETFRKPNMKTSISRIRFSLTFEEKSSSSSHCQPAFLFPFGQERVFFEPFCSSN